MQDRYEDFSYESYISSQPEIRSYRYIRSVLEEILRVDELRFVDKLLV
jgi:hypothetical protein